jgi:phage tail-like protein
VDAGTGAAVTGGRPLDSLAADLRAVVRRHDPAWTESLGSDPGGTLLEVSAWLAQRLGESPRGAAVRFTGEAVRADPYRNFKFRVKWEGSTVPGITRISPLRRTTDIVEHRDGASPDLVQRIPGRLTYEPITLERGIDANTAFEDWADQIRNQAPTYRKAIRIEVLDQTGSPVLAYDVYGCWPSAHTARPDLIETLTLVPEGWQRDPAVHP